MKVSIKNVPTPIPVCSKGVELGIRNSDSTHKGDLYITNKWLIWCKGKTHKENGVYIELEKLIESMESGAFGVMGKS